MGERKEEERKECDFSNERREERGRRRETHSNGQGTHAEEKERPNTPIRLDHRNTCLIHIAWYIKTFWCIHCLYQYTLKGKKVYKLLEYVVHV